MLKICKKELLSKCICSVCVCGMCVVCVSSVSERDSIVKWLIEHPPGNRKIPGLMPSYANLVFLVFP